jgi:hypothetical protein
MGSATCGADDMVVADHVAGDDVPPQDELENSTSGSKTSNDGDDVCLRRWRRDDSTNIFPKHREHHRDAGVAGMMQRCEDEDHRAYVTSPGNGDWHAEGLAFFLAVQTLSTEKNFIEMIVGFTGVTLTVVLWDRRSNRKRDGMKVHLGDGTTMTVTTVFCRPRTQVGMMNATVPAGVLPATANVIAVATQIIT